MSLSGVSDLAWRLQRDMLGVPGFAGVSIPPAFASGQVASPSAQSADSTSGGCANGSGGDAAVAQDIESFMQALYEALSNVPSAPTQSNSSAASSAASASGSPASPTYSRASVASYRSNGYTQGQKGLSGKIQSLISALSDPQDSPDVNIGSLQSAFSRLLSDLEAAGSTLALSLTGGGSALSLRSWLLGLQQNLAQPGATAFSAVGNLIDVTV